ncbi:phage terminase large subunit family protein [Streptosporangium sandarakinum]
MTAEIDDYVIDDEFAEETEAERADREALDVVLDEFTQKTVDAIVDKLMIVVDEVSGHPLYPYQKPFARRVIESLIIGDGATLTALFSRQSGKSETVANVVAACMIMFPVLARVFPNLMGKFKEGLWVGAFAPVDEQADNLYGRIVSRITSERALELMADPDIQDGLKARGRTLTLRSGSLVRRQTCHPRAIIEGRTYHLVLIDECQGADDKMVNKSITPMGASTNATYVYTGTPTYTKNVFYRTIQFNKREQTRRGQRQLHFEADYREASKANPNYKIHCEREKFKVGEDSDEFKLSYRLIWLLEQGMFTTHERLNALGDKSMQIVKAWHRSPVVVGIDPARKQDSTVVTVVWVDWDKPDEHGFFDHRILNWLELGGGMSWETQYYRILEFLGPYSLHAVGVDVGGVGDAVADRLKVLLPQTQIVELGSQRPDQSKRWKHLYQLIDRGKISWPAHAKTRGLRTYKRFIQQFSDLQIEYTGPYMLAAAPDEAHAHDDYIDSLAMACVLTNGENFMQEVEQGFSPFHSRR